MKQRTVFFVSDQTGITAETLGRSLLTQFDGLKFRYVTLPFIATPDKALDAVRRINLMAEVEGVRPLVFSTFVQNEIREIVRGCNGLLLDFFDAFIGPLERELERASSHTSGRAHGLADDAHYARRIDAVNFTLANDDGMGVQNYARADLILTGVSRSGKTPTCLYLALQYGVFAANFPLTDEHFDENERGELPSPLRPHAKKLVGLTIDAKRLEQIRANRKPDTRYASPTQISYELREAESLFKRHAIPFLDTTHASIEEIAIRVLDLTGLRDRTRTPE
jgi:[pyruvate, water dikinase]-phosphate phosphotransferase / [pyruvate, water dikinase] kinase